MPQKRALTLAMSLAMSKPLDKEAQVPATSQGDNLAHPLITSQPWKMGLHRDFWVRCSAMRACTLCTSQQNGSRAVDKGPHLGHLPPPSQSMAVMSEVCTNRDSWLWKKSLQVWVQCVAILHAHCGKVRSHAGCVMNKGIPALEMGEKP